MRGLFPALLLLLATTACGYRMGQGEAPWLGSTLTVPYVEGDVDGEITSALIRNIEKSGSFRYVDAGGRFRLKVKVVECRDENTGFRYDQDKTGALTTTLIPSESRKWILAQMELFECGKCDPVIGPVCLSASVDYDHGYHLLSNQLNVFSLGQLTDISSAGDAVAQPLSEAIAHSVMDYLMNSW